MTTAENGGVSEFAPAKVNLALHVTGQRADGYHLLDSLVMFANVGDRLSATPAREPSLQITGPMAEGVPADARNSVLQASVWAGVPMRMTLEKQLPHAAGIGGGSSDAAAALRAAEALTGQRFRDGAEALGADVPVCLLARAARMRGIGEDVAPLTGVPRVAAVLANPRFAVQTPKVFGALADKHGAPLPPMPKMADTQDLAAFLAARTRNDLQAPACALFPEIGEVLDRLWALDGTLLARMSGSGASCFALFDEIGAAEAAAEALAAQKPDWWISAVWLS